MITAFFRKAQFLLAPHVASRLASDEASIVNAVMPFTMTSPERVLSVIDAAKYVIRNHVEGAFVECGVWRGGSTMAAALTLLGLGETARPLYLYDTFEGMSEPESVDVDLAGKAASAIYERRKRRFGGSRWCAASLEDVQQNLRRTAYPEANIHFIKGRVEESIPANVPEQIALLRLDTDWYSSTLHELRHLYPRLSRGGVLIIDDYGHWQGARRAVDEYFGDAAPLLVRIDYTGRLAVKT